MSCFSKNSPYHYEDHQFDHCLQGSMGSLACHAVWSRHHQSQWYTRRRDLFDETGFDPLMARPLYPDVSEFILQRTLLIQ